MLDRRQSPMGAPIHFGEHLVKEMLYAGMFLDGRRGGLVIGPSHEEGNIYLLYQGHTGRYGIVGTMEGGEYLVSHAAYLLFKDRLDTINIWECPTTTAVTDIRLSKRTRIINAYETTFAKVILIDHRGQFIVNKFAVGKFISEIEELNCQAELWVSPSFTD